MRAGPRLPKAKEGMILATMANDPLDRHSLHDLEDAEKRLRAHISRRRPKPSLPRRITGLCISVLLIAGGLAIMTQTYTSVEKHFGKFMIVGGALCIAGIMWIYSDWFE